VIFEWDDQGANHVISDQCQSHDMREYLDKLHYINPGFKATLFAIPAEMTVEQFDWFSANKHWVELAVHGWKHTDNWEASKWTYDEADYYLSQVKEMGIFVEGFRAPGWQISDETYLWLKDNGWWVADQSYNNNRRPDDLTAYINHDGQFGVAGKGEVEVWHGHTWNCVGNGIEETFEHVKSLVENAKSFEFVSEVI
jgi:hypothetical protein